MAVLSKLPLSSLPAAGLPRVGLVRAASSSPPHLDDGLFSVAPMMDYTDRFMRFLLRRLTSRGTLYTEMVTANTIVHCKETELERFLGHEQTDGPTVFQLGGSDPEQLQRAAATVAEWGYDAINLNCGCPSDRVAGRGCFGAALMREPDLVADCCAAIAAGGGGLPVSVKCRIGVTEDRSQAAEIDEEPVYAELADFVQRVSERGGVRHFVVHACAGAAAPTFGLRSPPAHALGWCVRAGTGGAPCSVASRPTPTARSRRCGRSWCTGSRPTSRRSASRSTAG